jgi:hypothetical protein
VVLAVTLASIAIGPSASTAEGPQGRVGQFVVECPWSHSSFDDPIVHPGHAGASHRHDFFGNTSTSATSTYQQLLASSTTCQQRLDTAAYWAPSLLGADGTPFVPVSATAYYRVAPGVEPESVEPYPADLRMVGGGDTESGRRTAGWSCRGGAAISSQPPACIPGAGLHAVVTFPDCWDGDSVDSADHRRHVAYSDADGCPASHPVAMPVLELVIDYGALDVEGVRLSSGEVTSAHADFWNAWDQDKLETEVEVCLRRQHVCDVVAG